LPLRPESTRDVARRWRLLPRAYPAFGPCANHRPERLATHTRDAERSARVLSVPGPARVVVLARHLSAPRALLVVGACGVLASTFLRWHSGLEGAYFNRSIGAPGYAGVFGVFGRNAWDVFTGLAITL